MITFINYANEKVDVNGCPACAYVKHEFMLPCGMAFENDRFTLSQDWQLPIVGFMVISPKRCIREFSELTDDERVEMFDIINKTITILKKNKVCDNFNVVFEEKDCHFHVWIMPRHGWMYKISENIMGSVSKIFNYALDNFRTEENYKEIQRVNDILRQEFKL